MRRRTLIAFLVLFFSVEIYAQEKTRVTGVWELEVNSTGSSSEHKVVMMKQVGASLQVRDLETGKDYTGTVNDADITFPLTLKSSSSVKSVETSFDGKLKKGVMKGETEVGGSKVDWVAVRLTSLWLCTNHSPKHTAKSKEDMIKFTQQSRCEGWHKARPEDWGN